MMLEPWREQSPMFDDMSEEHFAFLSSLAEVRDVPADVTLFRVNTPADRFYLVLEGTVALLIAGPSRPPITIQTVGPGSLLGLSWHLPPYRWQWTAETREPCRLAEFDANAVLAACETDSDFDNAMLRVIAREAGRRLHNVRMQLLDLYGRE
jgi:CRP-like cAMP-binding protein